ncbi:MAG: phosphoribosylaminoimidazolesuccinocarboxamide synthase, partial [Acidiferrobacterales bacterium]|nr:phosphoribosylaminoimidazolesuccinocarboxamide synthase [Acidiferrobacterales bacterium]
MSTVLNEVPETLFESELSLPLVHRGKVRDVYGIGDTHLLIVVTDRLSAFDVVLPTPIPGKGRVLTAVSNFWFERMRHIVPNHLADLSLAQIMPDPAERAQVEGRAMVVRKLKPLPIEAIVRGYLIGSGWKDYQKSGAVCGIALPAGLRQADKLPQAIFTPSTKAAVGDHDENISFDQTVQLIGEGLAAQVSDVSIRLYEEAAAYALERGIIIADTKFEFGLDDAGRLT